MAEDEEVLQLRVDVERLRRSVLQKDEMIEELEQEMSKMSTSTNSNGLAEARERELLSQLRDLQMMCDSQSQTISNRDQEIVSLKNEISVLEESNRELVSRSSEICESDESSNSFAEAEMMKISEELERTKSEYNALLEEAAELKKELLTTKEDLDTAVEHVKSLENHINERNEYITRLEGEMFDLKNGDGSHASRGNSIFAEAMDAERKLEEDLKILFREKQCLKSMIKVLTDEKEDAEQRARNAASRGRIVKHALNEVDFNEIRRLRKKVNELEAEKAHLWDRLFIRMKSIPAKQLGHVIKGHFDGFRLSVEAFKHGQEQISKQNEELFIQNRRLQNEVEEIRYKLENVTSENTILTNRLAAARESQPRATQKTDAEPASIPPKGNRSTRPQLFSSLVVKNDMLNTPKPKMAPIMKTQQKTPGCSSKENRNPDGDEEVSDWVKKRLELKESKKKPQPVSQFNRVEFTMPERQSIFKQQTLFAPEESK